MRRPKGDWSFSKRQQERCCGATDRRLQATANRCWPEAGFIALKWTGRWLRGSRLSRLLRLEAGAIDPFAIQHQLIDLAEIPYVLERIGVEQQEVGAPSCFDNAQFVQLAQGQRPVAGGR